MKRLPLFAGRAPTHDERHGEVLSRSVLAVLILGALTGTFLGSYTALGELLLRWMELRFASGKWLWEELLTQLAWILILTLFATSYVGMIGSALLLFTRLELYALACASLFSTWGWPGLLRTAICIVLPATLSLPFFLLAALYSRNSSLRLLRLRFRLPTEPMAAPRFLFILLGVVSLFLEAFLHRLLLPMLFS